MNEGKGGGGNWKCALDVLEGRAHGLGGWFHFFNFHTFVFIFYYILREKKLYNTHLNITYYILTLILIFYIIILK